MSVSEEDVQRWFDVVLLWGSADTSEKCRDTFECLDELQVFLKQLENALEGMVCMNPCQLCWSIYREAFFLENNLDVTKPYHSKHIVRVLWPFVISGSTELLLVL